MQNALAALVAQSDTTYTTPFHIRLYHSDTIVQMTATLNEACRALVAQGHRVRVFEGSNVYTLAKSSDGTLVWTVRRSNKDRSKARCSQLGKRGYSVVEVSL